jgi:hypothetical protein
VGFSLIISHTPTHYTTPDSRDDDNINNINIHKESKGGGIKGISSNVKERKIRGSEL